MSQTLPINFAVAAGESGARLDQFLVAKLAEISRARVQQLIEQSLVLVDGKAGKASLRLRGGEEIRVLGPARLSLCGPLPKTFHSTLCTKTTTWP